MNATALPPKICQPRRLPLWVVVFSAIILFYGLLAIGVTSYFRLSGDTVVLKDAVLESLPPNTDRMFTLNVGPLTTGVLRTGVSFFELPPEAHAGIKTLRAAEVGVYRLSSSPGCFNPQNVFVKADKAMARRHWTRVVGVMKDDTLVAVYLPTETRSPGRIRCCVAVLKDRDLVVAALRGNLWPMLEIVRKQMEMAGHAVAQR